MIRNPAMVGCLSIPNCRPGPPGRQVDRSVQIFEGEPIRYRGRDPGSTPALLPGLAIRLRKPVSKVVTTRGGNPPLPAGSNNPGGTVSERSLCIADVRSMSSENSVGLDFSPCSDFLVDSSARQVLSERSLSVTVRSLPVPRIALRSASRRRGESSAVRSRGFEIMVSTSRSRVRADVRPPLETMP